MNRSTLDRRCRRSVLALAFACTFLAAEAALVTAAEEPVSGLDALVQLLGQVDDAAVQFDVLKGMNEALRGRRNVPPPAGWSEAYAALAQSESAPVRELALRLALSFGDRGAIESLRSRILDGGTSADERRAAVASLVDVRAKDLAQTLLAVLPDRDVRGEAIRGLAAYDDPAIPPALLRIYGECTPDERRDAVATLASRASFAAVLLDALEGGRISPREVSAFAARQVALLGDDRLTARLVKAWGAVGQTPEEKTALIATYKSRLTPEHLRGADLAAGRLVYRKACQQCHALYGEGGKIGPDITGSQRNNLDYILENILAPSAVVARDYQVATILTVDGRVISGMILEQGEKTVRVQTANEAITLPREDIDQLRPSPLSMMPDGLFDKLSPTEIRDLIAYLATREQVPLP